MSGDFVELKPDKDHQPPQVKYSPPRIKYAKLGVGKS